MVDFGAADSRRQQMYADKSTLISAKPPIQLQHLRQARALYNIKRLIQQFVRGQQISNTFVNS